ncbi:MAG: hypothetical protein IJ799_06055 [Bacteroidales bacterium]|nr:hypothetical protein [Bacteroidales bacterium]
MRISETWEDKRENRRRTNVKWTKENLGKVADMSADQDVDSAMHGILDIGVELVPPIKEFEQQIA